MTRLVCISDVHLDKVTMGVPRFEEGKRALWAAAKHAERDGAVFVFTGDLCDPDDNVAGTLAAMSEAVAVAAWLNEKGVRSVWLNGNHDVSEQGDGGSTLGPVDAMDAQLVHCASKPMCIGLDGIVLACLPFAPVSHAYDPDEAMREMLFETERDARVVVLGHLSIPGVVLGEETEEMPRGRDMPYPTEATMDPRVVLRISGHYHKRQRIDGGVGSPHWIVGSPMRFTAHDEQSDPGYLVVDL
jgi:DNA repair exonuclease SbcCD nuclease subunit